MVRMNKLYGIFALAAGASVALQIGLNQKLLAFIPRPYVILVSHLGGAALILIYIIFTRKLPSHTPDLEIVFEIPWYAWLGGFFGVAIVACITISMAHIPLTLTVSLLVAGELFFSLLIELLQTSLLQDPKLVASKIIGLVFVFAGTYVLSIGEPSV